MLFHNTEKTETRHGNAPQVLFVGRTTTAKYLTEACFWWPVLQQFHIADHCQISCCIIKFCYTWVNKCGVTRLRHKY